MNVYGKQCVVQRLIQSDYRNTEGATGTYRVYRVLQEHTECYRNIQSVQSAIGTYRVLQSAIGTYRVLQGAKR